MKKRKRKMRKGNRAPKNKNSTPVGQKSNSISNWLSHNLIAMLNLLTTFIEIFKSVE
jgi:hypothetical protein